LHTKFDFISFVLEPTQIYRYLRTRHALSVRTFSVSCGYLILSLFTVLPDWPVCAGCIDRHSSPVAFCGVMDSDLHGPVQLWCAWS